jgi:uncharacterized OsmC-like protein
MSSTPPRRVAKVEISITMPDKNYSEEEKELLERIALACPISKSLHPDLEQAVRFIW